MRQVGLKSSLSKIKWNKKQPIKWSNIFANHIFDELILKMYKELLQLNTTPQKITKYFNRYLFKENINQSTNIWKGGNFIRRFCARYGNFSCYVNSVSIGYNSVTWLLLLVKESGKCGLICAQQEEMAVVSN